MSYEVPSDIHQTSFISLRYAVFKVPWNSKFYLNLSFPSELYCLFLSYAHSGDGEIRTLDPLLARQVLSQLSYAPIRKIFPDSAFNYCSFFLL